MAECFNSSLQYQYKYNVDCQLDSSTTAVHCTDCEPIYTDNTAISYCFSLTQFVVLVMYVWWAVPTAQVV